MHRSRRATFVELTQGMSFPPMSGRAAPDLAAAALLTCALPSMSIAAALAEQHGEGEFGAAALLLSTVASFTTLTAWLFVVGALGWLPF